MIGIEQYRHSIGTHALRISCKFYRSNTPKYQWKLDISGNSDNGIVWFYFCILLYLIYVIYFAAVCMGVVIDCSSYPLMSNFVYPSLTVSVSYKLTIYTKLLSAILTCYIILSNINNKCHGTSNNATTFNIRMNPVCIFNNINKRHSAIIINVITWIHIMNFLLIVICNPSMLNPGPKVTRNLKIMYQNVQGLIPLSSIGDKNPSLNHTKVAELQSHIYLTKPDLVILNETWLKPSIADTEIIPSGYNIFRLDRSNYTHPTDPSDQKKFRKNGGGVLIAARCDLDMNIEQINLKCQAEILSIELKNPNAQKIIISTLYRVGTLGIPNHTRVQSYLHKIAKRRGISNLVLIGDLNLSKTNWHNVESSCEIEQSFIDMFSDLGLTQLINQPTHEKGNLLDVLLTKFPCNISNCKVADKDYICKSDHYGIHFELNSKAKREKSVKRAIYNLKKANWSKLNEDLSKIKWHKLLNSNNIEHGWNVFKQHLFENVNKHIPKIKIQSEFQPPWFDSETFELCREKERLRSKFKHDKSEASYMKFSQCCRDFKNLVKKKMNDNFCDDSNPDFINKKFWSYVKKSNNTHRIPNNVCYKNCHRTCKTDQAELFNQFFYDQFSTPSNYQTPVDYNKLLSPEYHIVFSHNEICKLLRCINPNKAHGPDGINGKI